MKSEEFVEKRVWVKSGVPLGEENHLGDRKDKIKEYMDVVWIH